MSLAYIIMLILIATLGYLIFYLLNLPTPAMLGPFVFVIVFSLFYKKMIPLGFEFNFVLQVLLGLHIGILVDRQVFKNMKTLLLTSLIVIVWTLVMTFGLGSFLTKYYQIDLATALLSTAPSGIAETGLLAVTVNADVGVVSIFQLSRMVLTLLLVPLIVKHQNKGESKVNKSYRIRFKRRYLRVLSLKERSIDFKDWSIDSIKPLITVALALLGGYVGTKNNIPAGALMGSFIIISILSLLNIKIYHPPKYSKTLMQIGIGTSMGINVVQESIYSIVDVLVPLVVFTMIMFLTSFFNAYLFKRINNWDNTTSILAAAPAGLTPMSILAYEHSENPLEVSIIHMTRLAIVKIVILPYIVYMLMK